SYSLLTTSLMIPTTSNTIPTTPDTTVASACHPVTSPFKCSFHPLSDVLKSKPAFPCSPVHTNTMAETSSTPAVAYITLLLILASVPSLLGISVASPSCYLRALRVKDPNLRPIVFYPPLPFSPRKPYPCSSVSSLESVAKVLLLLLTSH